MESRPATAAAQRPLGWEASILAQLEQREVRVATVAKVIQSYSRLAGKIGEFATYSREVETRSKELQSEHERLLENIESGGGMRGLPLAQQRISDLEREVEALKEERTELYRTQGTNAQRLLDISDKMRENDDALRRQALEIADANEELRRNANKMQDMRASLKEKDGTIQILQDEMSALQLEIVQIEERCKKLQAENDDLVKRWLQKMNAEAEKVNEVTQELELIKRKSAALSPGPIQVDIDDDSFFAHSPPLASRGRASTAPTNTVGKIDTRSNELHSIAISGNGQLLATGGQENTVKVFDAETGESIYRLSGCLKSVNHVEFNSDSSMLVAASSDNTARIWQLDTGRQWKSLSGHIGRVVTAKFNLDSSRVFTYSQDRTVKVWDTQRGLCMKTLFTISSCQDIALMSTSGSRILTAHMDNSIRTWDTVTGNRLQEASIHSDTIMSAWADQNGRWVLTNSRDGTLKLVDSSTLEVAMTMTAPGYYPNRNWARASLSPDERYAMAGSTDGKLYFWDLMAGGRLLHKLDIHRSPVCDALWNPAGTRVYSAEQHRYIMMLQ
ncbi:WD40 repeat-like protein [Martensiomyces pterosporus]|nr:WD40 repeat-like protein [Martensiomyces pterosporus]